VTHQGGEGSEGTGLSLYLLRKERRIGDVLRQAGDRHDIPEIAKIVVIHGNWLGGVPIVEAERSVAAAQPRNRSHQRRIMRYLAVLLATLVLAACSTAPVTRSESQAVSPTQVLAPELQKASIDSVVQFLLTAAATDFHTHRPPDPVRFRDVRIGHVMTPSGEERYMLCGQFLPAQEGGKAEWTPFVTIKTSGYEQWIGAHAVGVCQGSSVIWDTVGDLSSSLQGRLDSLR